MNAPTSHDVKPGVPMVRALERGIALLKAFSFQRPRLTLTELGRAASLDKGTTRRLLQTLRVAGLVDYDELTATFSLSVGVLELAASVETGRDLREVAAPYLAEVAEHTGATAFLWVYHEGTALCIDRVRAAAPRFDATWFRVGARATLNAGGGPRVILAHISELQRREALSLALAKRTPSTETDPRRLEESARTIRERGWELAVDDFVVGLAAVGVPIFDRGNNFVAALSVTSLTSQILDGDEIRNFGFLKEIAALIGGKVI